MDKEVSQLMSLQRWNLIKEFSREYSDILKNVPLIKKKAKSIITKLDYQAAFERFFTRESDMERRAKFAKEKFASNVEKILVTANNAVEHRFEILGSGFRNFGFHLEWHKDISSGYSWPTDADFLNIGRKAFEILVPAEGGTELKAAWDLSNMQWLMTLACAYHLTGDEKYSASAERDISDWIASNPPFKGVNWFCAMNVAIRAVNIITAVSAIYSKFDINFVRELLSSLYLHGVCISSNLELSNCGIWRNNHYLSDLLGLYFLGVLFKDCQDGKKWLDFAIKELENESDLQFYPDGTNTEDSTCYHRYSTEIMLLCAMLGEVSGNHFSEKYISKLRKSLLFTKNVIQSNNCVPQIGDNDNGRVLVLEGYMTSVPTDHRHILALGGEFLDDNSIRNHGLGMELDAIFFLGRFKGYPHFRISENLNIHRYLDSGYYIIKDNGTTIVIHNNRILKDLCQGGHSHCDQLAFTMNFKGDDIIVDPGSYVYSCDMQERNIFRSTEYHNTIQIGTFELNVFGRKTFEELWLMKDMAQSETEIFKKDKGKVYFKGKISSYLESCGVEVCRTIVWNSNFSSLKIMDSLEGNKLVDYPVVSRFLLAPGLSVRIISKNEIIIFSGKKNLAKLESSRKSLLSLRHLWFSPSYGKRVPCIQIEGLWNESCVNFNFNFGEYSK